MGTFAYIYEFAPHLLALAGLLFLSAFFSGSETAFCALSRARVRRLRDSAGRNGRAVSRILSGPAQLFTTVLVGNTLVNVALSSMVAALAFELLPGSSLGLYVSIVVSTFLLLVFGEYLPKAWFLGRPLERCRHFAPLLSATEIFFRPISVTLIWLTRWLVPGPSKTLTAPTLLVTREDLKVLAGEGEESGVLTSRERFMIHRVFELSGKTASQIMIPRDQMITVDANASLDLFSSIARETRFTRMPVYTPDDGKYIGIVNIFFVLSSNAKDAAKVADYARPPLFVPENMPVDDILPRMRRFHQPMCLVVDADDKVIGLLTTEDILEEIVGKL